MRKHLAILLSVGALLAVSAFSITGPTEGRHIALADGDDDDDGERCTLDGIWLTGNTSRGLSMETFIMHPGGRTGTFRIEPIIDGVPRGTVPVDLPAFGSAGNVRRIGLDLWEFEAISYFRTFTTDTELGELTGIAITKGTTQLVDCDTQVISNDVVELYSGDADTDGDGLPDEAPFAVFPGGMGSATRLANF